jgi:cobalamin biosynthesis protein CbiG
MKIIDDDGKVIAEGQVLSLKASDVVVFQTKRRLGQDMREMTREQLELLFPGNKVVVLDADVELNVLRHAS